MEVIKSPHSTEAVENFKIFLAGTIDNGKSIDWQSDLVQEFVEYDVTFLNPRRDVWNSEIKQRLIELREQLEWESDNLENSDLILMYLLPNSTSVISMAELGEYGRSGKDMIVCCPDGFWRKGNVEFLCEKFNLPLFDNYNEMVKYAKDYLKNKN